LGDVATVGVVIGAQGLAAALVTASKTRLMEQSCHLRVDL